MVMEKHPQTTRTPHPATFFGFTKCTKINCLNFLRSSPFSDLPFSPLQKHLGGLEEIRSGMKMAKADLPEDIVEIVPLKSGIFLPENELWEV